MEKLKKSYYEKERVDIQCSVFIFSFEVSSENMVHFFSFLPVTSTYPTSHSDQRVPYTMRVGTSTWYCDPKIVPIVPVTVLFKKAQLKGQGKYGSVNLILGSCQ